MAGKPVKIDAELYAQIVRFIKKSENKYKYPTISSFVNSTVYERLKENKGSKLFNLRL